jgi:hypothetical protein
MLNDEKVPPPRVYAKKRRTGWKDSTIRGRSLSRTGDRLPPPLPERPEAQIALVVEEGAEGTNPLSLERAHLQIVGDETWLAVERRLMAVHAKYTKNADGSLKGRALPVRASSYLFSSLLVCGICGSSMVIRAAAVMRSTTAAKRRGSAGRARTSSPFGKMFGARTCSTSFDDVSRRRIKSRTPERRRRR